MNQPEARESFPSPCPARHSRCGIKPFFLQLAVVLILLGLISTGQSQTTPYPDWTITGPAPVNNSTLTISASASHAGAITSLKLGDVEFVDNADHGRQIQSAIQLNGIDPSYNPNEAGSIDDQDGPSSSSELLRLDIPASNRLMTTTDMAYFFVKSSPLLTQEQKDHTVPPSNAPPDGQKTQFWTEKDVTIGPPGLPGNVIEYLCTFQPSVTTPPEPVTSSIASSAGVYLKYPDFSEAWTYDLATRTLLQHHDANGSDDMIKVMIRPSSPLGPVALSAYAPEHLQPYGSSANFGWWLDGTSPWPSTFLDPSHHATGPLPLSYRTYLVVGNPGEVTSSLDSLGLKFSSQDPDVFNWREYIQLNPDFWPYNFTETDARNHWLNNGINEGRTASYHFALGRYRNLNSDQWDKSNQAVIDHYIQYGRKEGRSTVPRADGGLQHTVVRSPQQDFVFARTSGANSYGQLGSGSTTGTASPVQLPDFGNSRVTDVAAGDFTTLAVLANGAVWMWGSNQNGARGDGSLGGQVNSPVQVPYLPPIVIPSTKDRHVVAVGDSAYAVLDNTGRVWTWGYGGNGQLGNESENSRFTPGVVQKSGGGDLTDIVSIAVGDGNFMVALDVDEHVWTWGYNGYGQLGNNTTTTSYTAVQVLTPANYTDTDTSHVCQDHGLTSPCTLYPPLAGIIQVLAGGSFCLALDRSGEVLAWGNNGTGQLGNYVTASRNHADYVQIPGNAKPIDKIAAGSNHALAHGNDDKVYVWGYNGWGQLGLSGVTYQLYPTAMPVSEATTNITDVAAGSFFSLLVRSRPYESDRKIFGVGDNQSGQLGANDYVQHNSPVLTSF